MELPVPSSSSHNVYCLYSSDMLRWPSEHCSWGRKLSTTNLITGKSRVDPSQIHLTVKS